jgi:hypothetical protein
MPHTTTCTSTRHGRARPAHRTQPAVHRLMVCAGAPGDGPRSGRGPRVCGVWGVWGVRPVARAAYGAWSCGSGTVERGPSRVACRAVGSVRSLCPLVLIVARTVSGVLSSVFCRLHRAGHVWVAVSFRSGGTRRSVSVAFHLRSACGCGSGRVLYLPFGAAAPRPGRAPGPSGRRWTGLDLATRGVFGVP